jgi:hypothetical protein
LSRKRLIDPSPYFPGAPLVRRVRFSGGGQGLGGDSPDLADRLIAEREVDRHAAIPPLLAALKRRRSR